MSEETVLMKNFIQEQIDADLASGRYSSVMTRFPPEPNGYLHIGHAKALCIDFDLAAQYGGKCNLRFDDTNPVKEEVEYVDAILEDIHWLGYEWAGLYYASDYFDDFLRHADILIRKGLAYVCELSAEEIREYRGTLTEPGRNSPYRERSVEENLTLFAKMRDGGFAEGEAVLRAKIDMSSPNLNMRDPVIYRILNVAHHRTGDKYKIYPMYDFAHPISDSIEGITHSLCSLEYEDHRPLYEWVIEHADCPFPTRQIEFSRLNMTYTVMSKRKLLQLVNNGMVHGWDDPRLPTLQGLRRRGYTPGAIRDFVRRNGVSKTISVVDAAFLEHCVREDLSMKAPRRMAVLEPIKLIIDNYPEDKVEYFDADNHPDVPEMGSRKLPFCKELYIEANDFSEAPPKGYYRFFEGNEVRLRHAYYVRCTHCVKDETGRVIEVHGTYDPESGGGWTKDERKVRGTIHWVSARHAVAAKVRLFENLFSEIDPDTLENYADGLAEESEKVLEGCLFEAALADAPIGEGVQFMRHGYFCPDKDSTPQEMIFNRTVSLKDSFKKQKAKG